MGFFVWVFCLVGSLENQLGKSLHLMINCCLKMGFQVTSSVGWFVFDLGVVAAGENLISVNDVVIQEGFLKGNCVLVSSFLPDLEGIFNGKDMDRSPLRSALMLGIIDLSLRGPCSGFFSLSLIHAFLVDEDEGLFLYAKLLNKPSLGNGSLFQELFLKGNDVNLLQSSDSAGDGVECREVFLIVDTLLDLNSEGIRRGEGAVLGYAPLTLMKMGVSPNGVHLYFSILAVFLDGYVLDVLPPSSGKSRDIVVLSCVGFDERSQWILAFNGRMVRSQEGTCPPVILLPQRVYSENATYVKCDYIKDDENGKEAILFHTVRVANEVEADDGKVFDGLTVRGTNCFFGIMMNLRYVLYFVELKDEEQVFVLMIQRGRAVKAQEVYSQELSCFGFKGVIVWSAPGNPTCCEGVPPCYTGDLSSVIMLQAVVMRIEIGMEFVLLSTVRFASGDNAWFQYSVCQVVNTFATSRIMEVEAIFDFVGFIWAAALNCRTSLRLQMDWSVRSMFGWFDRVFIFIAAEGLFKMTETPKEYCFGFFLSSDVCISINGYLLFTLNDDVFVITLLYRMKWPQLKGNLNALNSCWARINAQVFRRGLNWADDIALVFARENDKWLVKGALVSNDALDCGNVWVVFGEVGSDFDGLDTFRKFSSPGNMKHGWVQEWQTILKVRDVGCGNEVCAAMWCDKNGLKAAIEPRLLDFIDGCRTGNCIMRSGGAENWWLLARILGCEPGGSTFFMECAINFI